MGSPSQGLTRPGHFGTMPDNPEIWKAVAMADHFEKIQKLPDPIPGVPNFRRVPGYKVYCCGQPTAAALETTLNKVCGEIYPKDKKIIWFNMRQEPTVYINGEPVCARPPNKIGEHAELGNVTSKQLEEDEAEFVRVCEGQMKANDNKVKVVDVNKQEGDRGEDHHHPAGVDRCPAGEVPRPGAHQGAHLNSASPNEVDFDTITSAMVGSSINTPIILNDQVGLSRATTGSVAACLFKEFQINASFEGLVETVPGMDLNLLKMDRYAMDMKKDALFRGEFEVIKELVSILPDGEAAKRECDKVIDKNGPAKTGGTGIKQLRENIAESKLSYEIMDDAAQVFLKSKIMDNIHKYFYMIAFTGYIREMAAMAISTATDEDKAKHGLAGGKISTPGDQLKLAKTFVAWMEEHAKLRTIVEEGKGKLQWERDIPASALSNLESLASSDFKANLGKIIHDIYQTAHTMFSDMPQGDHKKRAKYRFASKTLMRILPVSLKSEVEGLIEKKAITLDLYEILGQCTWGQKAAEKA